MKIRVTIFALVSVLGSPSFAVEPLTWPPPKGWENFENVVIPATGGTLMLPDNVRDYPLNAPEIITGKVRIRGGRNVVWIGGHVRIAADRSDNPGERHGILIDDGPKAGVVDGRVVFLEGIRLEGDGLSEGVDTKAPKAHVVLQNIGIDTIRHRGVDDRDSTGKYAANLPLRNHPDIIQLFGGYKSLSVDGLSGQTGYQGLQLIAESRPAGSIPGPIKLRRINLEAVETPDEIAAHRHAGHVGLSWYGDSTGQMFVDNGTVWFQHHIRSGWGATGGFRKGAYRDSNGSIQLQPVSGASEFQHNFRAGRKYPNSESNRTWLAQRGQDDTGAFITWPVEATAFNGKPALRNWNDSSEGRIHSGRPSTGDYVPLDSVGLNYRSPGYAREITNRP